MAIFVAARRNPWFVVYVATGVGVLLNLLGMTYLNAAAVCEMYPHFSFQETLRDEMSMHSTQLPLLSINVPTLHLLSAYVIIYAVKHWELLDQGWSLLVDLLSGRWLYHQLFAIFSTHLPFVFSEPDLPELVSDDEVEEVMENEEERELVDGLPSKSMDKDTCNEAMAKLLQVKLQFADQTIPRPDNWLVFDPVEKKLVLRKHATITTHSTSNGHGTGLSEFIEDSQAPECATARKSPSKVAHGTRTRQCEFLSV